MMLPLTLRQRSAAARLPPEINLGDVINPKPASNVEDPGGNVLGAVIDDMRSAARPRSVGLFRGTDGGNHRRPAPGRQLHRIMADSTGTASDKQRLSLHRSGDENRAVRGHRRHAKCCALSE